MSDRFTPALFAMLAAVLLLLTLCWHVPIMLWDHLDLVPIYAAWHEGHLNPSTLLAVHGGHLHALAYAVLLLTTYISSGHPWLDCTASWLLLVLYAAIVMSFPRATFSNRSIGNALAGLLLFLALYPGHLANLQWGWQVAVFLCLFGAAITIRMLTQIELSPMHVAVAAVATATALLSFATSAALVPTAIMLIAMRRELSFGRRLLFALPWLVLGGLFAMRIDAPASSAVGSARIGEIFFYTLNFLGAGIARFASDLAPWVAIAGLISAAWAFITSNRRNDGLPWLGLVLFAVLAGVSVALARAAPFGDSHAFVTRYVSFSSAFWLGWTGLMSIRMAECGGRIKTAAVVVVGTLAFANALHMMKKAYEVGTRAAAIEQTIRSTYPQVDRSILAAIYFDQPDVARSRLETLRVLGFPPFDTAN
jgi:hypothetical protein